MSRIWIVLLIAVVSRSAGCRFTDEPRRRLGSCPTSTMRTKFIDTLGSHSYEPSFAEKGGIAYTCRGGHIDVVHARIAIDYTRYLSNKAREHLLAGETCFTFSMNVEPGIYHVNLLYPPEWDQLSDGDRDLIIDEISIELGQYLTFTMMTWHEVMTWYGLKTMGLISEFPSAFSWEDNYSNVLGVIIGAEVAHYPQEEQDEIATELLAHHLEELGLLPRLTAKEITESVRGEWFTGNVFPTITRRNFDIGLYDGFVTPILVPGVCDEAQPFPLPVPGIQMLEKYGFALHLEVEPKEWEREKVLSIVHGDNPDTRITLIKDLPLILEDMKAEACSLGYRIMPPGKEHYWGCIPDNCMGN